MKKLAIAIAIALCGALIASPVQAKTFVAVLWPMFGPLPAIGLVELTAEIKMMPDVEVETYVHQAWPKLVEDLDHLPPGTHTVVIGYSLGANSTVFVANNTKYIDLIIALQPSMLSWNPPLTGKVGRMIEIYNPNPWLTWGGMGSKKLEGANIEYIANTDSHPGAQFNSEFRTLAKTEIAKFTAQDQMEKDRPEKDRLETAQAAISEPLELAAMAQSATLDYAEEAPAQQPRDMAQSRAMPLPKDAAAKDHRPIAQSAMPKLAKPVAPDRVAQQPPKPEPKDEPGNKPRIEPTERAAFLDSMSNAVHAGDLSGARELTPAAMMDYVKRAYGVAQPPAGDDIVALSK